MSNENIIISGKIFQCSHGVFPISSLGEDLLDSVNTLIENSKDFLEYNNVLSTHLSINKNEIKAFLVFNDDKGKIKKVSLIKEYDESYKSKKLITSFNKVMEQIKI